jgi:EmrB/QacA subfamily drug resistance transporter
MTKQAHDPARLSHGEVRTIIIGILLAMFLAAVDQTIVATALPTIGRDLGDEHLLSWIVTAYLLTSTAVTPLYGKLSDIVGRRAMLLTAIAIFVAGSVLCAVSPTMTILIIARAVQGVGGGGLISLAQTIIADVVTPAERGRYMGYVSGVFVASSVLGPVLGGVFSEYLSWTAVFWVNLPLGFAAWAITARALAKLPRHERPARLDVTGALLMIAFTVSLLLALSLGGVRFTWGSTEIATLFAAFVVLLGLFIWRQVRAEEPLLPPAMMLHKVVGAASIASTFSMMAFIALATFLPTFFEAARGASAGQSGLMLMPMTCGTVVGATYGGRFMVRVRHYRVIAVVGLALSAVGILVLALLPADIPYVAIAICLFAVGAGIGPGFPVATVAVQNAVEPWRMGVATGSLNFVRSLGGAVGTAIFGAVIIGMIDTDGVGGTLNLTGPEVAPLMFAAFHWIFGLSILFLCVGIFWYLRMAELPLRGAAPAVHAVAE